MQLGNFGLLAALQLCLARYTHVHISSHQDTRNCTISLYIGSTTESVFARSTALFILVEADVDIQYSEVYATMSAASQETPFRKQNRLGLQPTNIASRHYFQAVPSREWTDRNDINLTSRSVNYSFVVHRSTFQSTTTPLLNTSLKSSSSTIRVEETSTNHNSFSSLKSYETRHASRFNVLITILILTGVALFS